jgi:hypothetical protein
MASVKETRLSSESRDVHVACGRRQCERNRVNPNSTEHQTRALGEQFAFALWSDGYALGLASLWPQTARARAKRQCLFFLFWCLESTLARYCRGQVPYSLHPDHSQRFRVFNTAPDRWGWNAALPGTMPSLPCKSGRKTQNGRQEEASSSARPRQEPPGHRLRPWAIWCVTLTLNLDALAMQGTGISTRVCRSG